MMTNSFSPNNENDWIENVGETDNTAKDNVILINTDHEVMNEEDPDLSHLQPYAEERNVYIQLPLGNYQMRIEDVISKKTYNGNPVVQWTLIVTKGQYAGKKIKRQNTLTDSQKSINLFLNDVEYSCGIRIKDLSTINTKWLRDNLVGKRVKVVAAFDKYSQLTYYISK